MSRSNPHHMREGRSRAGALIIALSLLSLTPIGGQAAVRAVDVMSNRFQPDVLVAWPGTDVDFSWVHGGHTVTDLGMGFDSGLRQEGATFRVGFEGGTLRYRCTIHSQIEPSSGQCQGMCGVITEQLLDYEPPSIQVSAPRAGEIVLANPRVIGAPSAVKFRGSAWDDRAVAAVRLRVRDVLAWKEYSVTCFGCGTPTAVWETSLSLLPGRYQVQATAADPSSNIGRSPIADFVVV